MVKRLSLLLCLVSFLTGFAADISLEVDRVSTKQQNGKTIYTASLGQPFIVKVIASTDKTTGDIEVTGLDRLSVMGQSQSSHITSINGVVSRQITYNITVMADQEGTFTIGPAHVTINGQPVSSNSITIHVSKHAQTSNNEENTDQGPEETTAFCKLLVDNTSVVVGQPITARLKIFTHGPIRNISLEAVPKFSGFLTKEIKHAQSKQEVFEGKEYNVTEKKYILFPLKQGEKVITPVSVVVDVPVQMRRSRKRGFFDDDFFSDFFGPRVSRRQIKTSPIAINVNPIPNYKKRVDGVGQFTQFKATLDKKEASINEPVVLTLRIEGKGNLDQLPAPKLRLPKHFKYYDSKTVVNENLDVNYTGGEKTFEFVIQANKPGLLKIPTQSFTFYDTEKKRFKTLTTNALTLEIQGAESYVPEKPKPHPPKIIDYKDKEKPSLPSIKAAEDIHFIQEETARPPSSSIPWWLFLLLLIIPALLYQKVFLSYAASLIKKLAGKKSLSQFNDQLDTIIKNRQAIKLHHFFLSFFATKYAVNISQVTEDWMILTLRKEKWKPEKIDEFIEYIHVCAGLHFASHTKQEDKHLLKRAQYWLLNLNK